MTNSNLTVVQCTKGAKDNYVTKLTREIIVDLGLLGKKTKKETYYISVSQEVKVGEIISVNMDLFNIVEHPGVNPATSEEIMLKWLHLK
jgi:hypothetical protein